MQSSSTKERKASVSSAVILSAFARRKMRATLAEIACKKGEREGRKGGRDGCVNFQSSSTKEWKASVS